MATLIVGGARGLTGLSTIGGGSSNTNNNITPTQGNLVITGYAPAVAQSVNQNITPSAGSFNITGYVPSISQPKTITAGNGSLTLTGYAPSVVQGAGQNIQPTQGSISFTGYIPSIAQSLNQAITPNVGALAFTGYIASVVQSANQALTPNVGSVTITGYAPTVTQASSSINLTPNTGNLTITGYAPLVAQSGEATYYGGGFSTQRKNKQKANQEFSEKLDSELTAQEAEIKALMQVVIVKSKKTRKSRLAEAKFTLPMLELPQKQVIAKPKVIIERIIRQDSLISDDETDMLLALFIEMI